MEFLTLLVRKADTNDQIGHTLKDMVCTKPVENCLGLRQYRYLPLTE